MTSVEQKQAVLEDLKPIIGKYRRGEELSEAERNKVAVANLLFPPTGGANVTQLENVFGGADNLADILTGKKNNESDLSDTGTTTPTLNLNVPTVNSKEGKQRIKGVKKDNPKATEEFIISTLLDKGLLLPEE